MSSRETAAVTCRWQALGLSTLTSSDIFTASAVFSSVPAVCSSSNSGAVIVVHPAAGRSLHHLQTGTSRKEEEIACIILPKSIVDAGVRQRQTRSTAHAAL